jgi:hypothetical protein
MHMLLAQHALGFELVMWPAQQAKVLERRLAAVRDWRDVVDLQPTSLLALVTVRADERAVATVPLPDQADQWHRDPPPACRGRGGAGLHAQPHLLEVRDEELHGLGVDERRVARRHRVAQERLRVAKVGVLFIRERKAGFVAARGRYKDSAAVRRRRLRWHNCARGDGTLRSVGAHRSESASLAPGQCESDVS